MYDLKDEYEEDITKCPKCGGYADNGFDRCVPPSPYWCSRCEMEEKDLYATFSDATYKIPMKEIAKIYATTYLDKDETWERLYNELLRKKEEDIIHWANYNIDWKQIKNVAKRVDIEIDHEHEWIVSDKHIA